MTVSEMALPDWLTVSAQTTERLHQFAALVVKWNPAVNLVSKSSLSHLWQRHILDSAQVFNLAPTQARNWVDLGSGGGFPGLVIALLAAEHRPDLRVTLVEADQRKSVFLADAARQLGIVVAIHALRIEELPPQNADVLTARALAPLDQLCDFVARHLKPGGVALLQKGAAVEPEVIAAGRYWHFDLHRHVSLTDPTAAILELKALAHV